MKPWMLTLLTLAFTAVIVGIGWGLFTVIDSANAVVNQGRLMMGSIRGTTFQLHKLAQDSVETQKALNESIGKLMKASTESIQIMSASSVKAMEKMVASAQVMSAASECLLNETSLLVNAIRTDTLPRINSTVDESANTLKELQNTIKTTNASVQKVSAELTASIQSLREDTHLTMAEIPSTIAETRKLVSLMGAITQSMANVASYYENKILHPKGWDKVKWVVNVAALASGVFLSLR